VNFLTIILGVSFVAVSSLILAYVSMVTMIGPWIAPSLVLVASLFLKLRVLKLNSEEKTNILALSQSIGSVGGIVGVAIGFSLPTLYFLDPLLFNTLLSHPLYFCSLIGIACIAAGSLGMYLARVMSEKLINQEKLAFPVSKLIHKMIASQAQGKEVKNMVMGFSLSSVFCFVRDGIGTIKGFLPKVVFLFQGLAGKEIALALFQGPTLWAVGFTTGAMITVPLLVGMLSKYLVLYPINMHSTFLPVSLFAPLTAEHFSMAFCSGLVLAEALLGLPDTIIKTWRAYSMPQWLRSRLANMFSSGFVPSETLKPQDPSFLYKVQAYLAQNWDLCFALLTSVALFTFLDFSLPAQCFVLVGTVIAAQQLSIMGAKAGLIPFGRFATFVMVPAMLLFPLNNMQLTLLVMFVNIAAAVASDLLFDYKVGALCSIKLKRIYNAQWVGLIATSLCMGFFLWLLFTNFQLGSPELFAQRGKTRALMVQATHFNMWVLLLGLLYGSFLSRIKVSPALVLGGILMNNSISIGLIMGGLCSKLFKQPEEKFTFWSGVFAAESLWILLGMLIKLL
jgi:uncharacterized oligopeptide transporter (OPT) family protein